MRAAPDKSSAPKCPKCKATVGYLLAADIQARIGVLKKDGEFEERLFGSRLRMRSASYSCPECDAELFTTETRALHFLNGRKR